MIENLRWGKGCEWADCFRNCVLGKFRHLQTLNLVPIPTPPYMLFVTFIYFCFVLFCFCFLGPYLQHMEVPKLGVKLELYTTAYTTATAMQDWSHICNPHHSPWQCRILNPLYEARDQTCILMDDRFVSAEP